MRNTAMAVTIDIGNPDDVHPTDKVDVALRLARAARALTYGETVEYDGPDFRQATPEGASIRAWFDHAKGLTAKGGEVTGLRSRGSRRQVLHLLPRTIEGETIVASSPRSPSPSMSAMAGPTARSAICSTAKACPLRPSLRSAKSKRAGNRSLPNLTEPPKLLRAAACNA